MRVYSADVHSTGSVNNKRRKLDDEELDSGDDEDRHDREGDGADGDNQEELQDSNANVMDANIGRHPDPRPSDGEVRITGFNKSPIQVAI